MAQAINYDVSKQAGKGANVEALRNINKIKLYRYSIDNEHNKGANTETIYKNDSKEDKPIFFEAYSKDPVGTFSAGVATDSLMKSLMDSILDPKTTIGKIAGNIAVNAFTQAMFGYASSTIQYDYNYLFKGLTEFNKTFNCYLQVTNDFYEDIAKPLYDLIRFIMPEETETLQSTEFAEKAIAFTNLQMANAHAIDDARKNLNEQNKQAKESGGQIMDSTKVTIKEWNGSTKDVTVKASQTMGEQIINTLGSWALDLGQLLWDKSNQYFGGITALKPPPQLDQKTALKLVIGDFIILENIIIDKVEFKLPFLTYEKGLFDRVDLTLYVKGTRGMTVKTFDWLRQIQDYSAGAHRTSETNKIHTLNARFDGLDRSLKRR